jgi:hypothetical protein
MDPSKNGDYSWEFNSGTGLYMYNGNPNSTSGLSPVFSVTDSGLTVSGTIQASGGYIGGTNGWTISEYKLTSSSGTVGLYSGTTSKNSSPIRFFAGSSGSSTMSSAPFIVTANGSLYASKGYIGGDNGWTINTGNISSGSVYLYSTD